MVLHPLINPNPYSHLNPASGTDLKIPPDVCDEFLRGAVTSVLSTWECFVDDLCLDIVVRMDGSGNSSSEGSVSSVDTDTGTELKRLRKRWPNCQKVIQDAIKRRGSKGKKPLEVVAFGKQAPHWSPYGAQAACAERSVTSSLR